MLIIILLSLTSCVSGDITIKQYHYKNTYCENSYDVSEEDFSCKNVNYQECCLQHSKEIEINKCYYSNITNTSFKNVCIKNNDTTEYVLSVIIIIIMVSFGISYTIIKCKNRKNKKKTRFHYYDYNSINL